jgi:hypothetical protein
MVATSTIPSPIDWYCLEKAFCAAIGDDHDEQDVGGRQRSGLSLHDEAQDAEQAEVHQRTADDHLRQRMGGDKKIMPVNLDQLIHAATAPVCGRGKNAPGALRVPVWKPAIHA